MLAARDHARKLLQEARKRWDVENSFGRAALEEAALHLQEAEEIAPLAIAAQEAELRRCQAELEKIRLDVRRAKQMWDDKAIPRSQFDSVLLGERQAEEQLARSKATLAKAKKDRDMQMSLARAELKSAQAVMSRNQLATQLESLPESLNLAEARLERTMIRAPLAGEIIKILTHAGECVNSKPILKMGNTKSMFAIAEVYETDVRYLRPGLRAAITSKAFPERLMGRVERVSTMIHKNDVLHIDPTADADARVIEARIRLDDSTLAAHYIYLQVDVHIDVEPVR
jgi:HlyD family secretion protein